MPTMKRLKRLARTLRQSLSQGTKQASRRTHGDQARDRGDWGDAASHYRAHLIDHANDFDIWVQLGHAYKEIGRYDDSEAAYAAASRIDASNADLLLCRGHLAKLREDFEGAIAFYGQSFALNGNPQSAREMTDPLLLSQSTTSDFAPAPAPLRVAGVVESLYGSVLSGWASAFSMDGRLCNVEVLVDGQVIARGAVGDARVDVTVGGYGDSAGTFRIDLAGKIDLAREPLLTVRLGETGEILHGSPFKACVTPLITAWLERHAGLKSDDVTARKIRYAAETAGRKLSLILLVQTHHVKTLRETLDSIAGQWCPHWELLCVLPAEAPQPIEKLLSDRAAKDPRVRLLKGVSNGVGGMWAAAVGAASSDLIMTLESSGLLEPEMVFRFLDAVVTTDADIAYCDEVLVGPSRDSVEHVVARSAFSLDAFLSSPGLPPALAMSRRIALELAAKEGAAEVVSRIDRALGAIVLAETVAHIPALLMRTRASDVFGTGAGRRLKAIVSDPAPRLGVHGDFAPVRNDTPPEGSASEPDRRTLVVIVSRSGLAQLRNCLKSVLRTTPRDEVDVVVVSENQEDDAVAAYLKRMSRQISAMGHGNGTGSAGVVNAAVAKHAGRHPFVCIASDQAVFRSGWLEKLTSLASRKDVAVAAPLLIDRSGAVASAGIVFGRDGRIGHRHQGLPLRSGGQRSPGYENGLVAIRNVSAASGACIVLKTETYQAAGGLDLFIEEGSGVLDLCLRLGQLGQQILIDPDALITVSGQGLEPFGIANDSGLFKDRWSEQLVMGDPFYSPLLSPDLDHGPGRLQAMFAAVRVRRLRAGPTTGGRRRLVPDVVEVSAAPGTRR